MQAVLATCNNYVFEPIKEVGSSTLDIISRVAFAIFDTIKSVILFPVNYFFPSVNETPPRTDSIDKVVEKSLSGSSQSSTISSSSSSVCSTDLSAKSHEDIPPSSDEQRRENDMRTDSWTSSRSNSEVSLLNPNPQKNDDHEESVTSTTSTIDHKAGHKEEIVDDTSNNSDHEGSVSSTTSTIDHKADQQKEIVDDTSNNSDHEEPVTSTNRKADHEEVVDDVSSNHEGSVTQTDRKADQQKEIVDDTSNSSDHKEPITSATSTTDQQVTDLPTEITAMQINRASPVAELKTPPTLSKEDKAAIESFVSGRRRSLTNWSSTPGFDDTQAKVAALDPMLVVEFISKNPALQAKVNVRDGKWSTIKEHFIREVSKTEHPLHVKLAQFSDKKERDRLKKLFVQMMKGS